MIDPHQTVLRMITKHAICFWEIVLYKYFIFRYSPSLLNEGIHRQVKSVCIKRHSRIVKLRELSHPGDCVGGGGGGEDKDLSPFLLQRALTFQGEDKVSFSLERRMGSSHV